MNIGIELPLTLPVLGLSLICAASSASTPPITEQQAVTEQLHGVTITDEFRWLEQLERDAPPVAAWTDQQHAFTRATLDALPCREHLTAQLRPLLEIPSYGLPRMRRGIMFFTERTGRENQPALKTRPVGGGDAMTLLDPNLMSAAGLISLDWWMPSHKGARVAYGLSEGGNEMSVLRVRAVMEQADYADRIEGKVSFGGWFPDQERFVYGVLRDAKDPYSREWRVHRLGEAVARDPVLLRQDHPSDVPFLGVSFDGEWFIGGYSHGWASNDLFIAPALGVSTDRVMNRIPIATGLDARFDPVGVQAGNFYFTTTWNSPRGRLLCIDLRQLTQPKAVGEESVLSASNKLLESARTVISEHPTMVMEDVSLALGKVVITWQQDASSRVSVANLDGTNLQTLTLPGIGTATTRSEDLLHQGFFAYTSYNSPTTIYTLDWSKPEKSPTVWVKPDVPVDPTKVAVEQEFATSTDGTRIPYFIIHRTDLQPRDGGHPCVLYGYGGFNIALTPSFIASNWPWYMDGGVYVVANLRGGSEYGEDWHRAGMLGRKQNVYDDLYSVAADVIARKWTASDRLAVMGRSNGGLLVGTAVTQRPDLFACGICGVPLLDMLRYDQFLLAKYWVPEYGDPANAADFAWLHAYSPYHHVTKGTRYPALFVSAGENDSRVHPMHARKMVARMQTLASNDPLQDPIMLWVDREAGHGAGKPMSKRLEELVDEWSFVEWQTGLCSGR
ncbi:MAG: S9 family peptidase [Phycisphaerales bacterium]|nr:S9 family peptidase [Phycisphaerales bacterium]